MKSFLWYIAWRSVACTSYYPGGRCTACINKGIVHVLIQCTCNTYLLFCCKKYLMWEGLPRLSRSKKITVVTIYTHKNLTSETVLFVLILWKLNRMQCKMVFNFTVHHDHAFRSCQTRWLLIGLRNLILIGQLRVW